MSIATTIASVTHAVLVVTSPGALEAIFGTVALVPRPHLTIPELQAHRVRVFFTGGVEAAVSIIVCSMSVIIPAILRALGVGDPFMQEDTVDLNFSTSVDIAHTTLTRAELGLPMPRGTAISDSDESEGAFGMTVSRQRELVDLGVKDSKKHRLTTQVSDGSLGDSRTAKVLPLADECDVTDSLTFAVVTDQDIVAGTEEERAKRNST